MNMVKLIYVFSKLNTYKQIKAQFQQITSELPALYVNSVAKALQVAEKIEKNDLPLIAVANSGSERMIEAVLKMQKRKTIVWANPHKNSLAAALKVQACYREQIGRIYAEIAEFKQKLDKIVLAHSVLNKLHTHKLGMIGKPSGWLLTSDNFSGLSVWMANPSQIDKKTNTLLLAHCSVPTKLLTNKHSHTLVTHMESDLSVALLGRLVPKEVTLLRFGKDYKKMQLVSGKVLEDPAYSSQLCRTHAKIQLNQDIERWMQASLGNHQVLIPGDWSYELEIFARLANLMVV